MVLYWCGCPSPATCRRGRPPSASAFADAALADAALTDAALADASLTDADATLAADALAEVTLKPSPTPRRNMAFGGTRFEHGGSFMSTTSVAAMLDRQLMPHAIAPSSSSWIR